MNSSHRKIKSHRNSICPQKNKKATEFELAHREIKTKLVHRKKQSNFK